MAPRIRTIKPEFWSKERLAKVSRDARLLFIGLINFADDEGRLRGSHLLIRAQVFPYDLDVDVEECLAQLEREQRIQRYVVHGESYIWVCNFEEHQKIDKPKASNLPAPPQPTSRGVADPSTTSRDDSTTHQEKNPQEGSGVEGSGMERKGGDAPRQVARSAPTYHPPDQETYANPTTPREQWTWSEWLQWALFTRQEAGLSNDKNLPHIHKMEEWWLAATKWTAGAVQPICDAFIAFGKDEFWQKKSPPLPLRGFLSQWERFMPIRKVKHAS